MDIDLLRTILESSVKNSVFSIAGDKFQSKTISNLLRNFIANETLTIRNGSIQTGSDEIVLTGTLGQDFLSVAQPKVEAVFYVKDSNAEVLMRVYEFPISWRLRDSFPFLAGSLADDLSQINPQFILNSLQCENASTQEGDVTYKNGLSFKSSLNLSEPLEKLAPFMGSVERKMEGPIKLGEGYSELLLESPIEGKTTFGDFKLGFGVQFSAQAVETAPEYSDAALQLTSQLEYSSAGQNFTIPVQARIMEPDVVFLSFESDLEEASVVTLKELSALLGKTPFTIPPEFPALQTLSLKELSLDLFVPRKKIIGASALVAFGDNWELIPGLIQIADLELLFAVNFPLGSAKKSFSVTVSGEVALSETQLTDETTVEGLVTLPQLVYQCELSEGSQFDITAFLETILPIPLDIPDIVCTGFKVTGDVRNKAYSFFITLQNDWEEPAPGDRGFALENVSLSIAVEREETDVQFNATFNLAGVDFYVLASYENEALSFSGSTVTGVHIDSLIDDLAEKFGTDKHIPATLSGLEFEKLHVIFNTGSKDFTFTGEAKFAVDDDPRHQLDIAVSIDIQHSLDGSVQKRFSGAVAFGDHKFDLIFSDADLRLAATAAKPGADSARVSTFLAAYRDTSDQPPGIRDLVGLVSDDPNLTGNLPQITTQSAFFAYQRQKSGTAAAVSRWLFGLNIEGGLNLSDIKLPDLPLLSGNSPPDLSLKLDLQLLVAGKGDFGQAELALIGDLNASDEFTLPDTGIKKNAVDLATVLRADGEVIPLNLPVKATGGGIQADSSAQRVSTGSVDAISTDADQGTIQWVKLQKRFGPLHVERLGLQYQHGEIAVLLDAGIAVAGLTVSFNGLEVDTPLSKFDPHFHLSGIGIDYKGGAVEVGGAFLKRGDAFSGLAVLRAEELALAAVGSYGKLHGEPSLFIYAALDSPLGGPPFFFVTGLAAGFGYNRRVIEPPVEQVHRFPLVSEAISGPAPLPADQEQADQTLAAKLAALDRYIPPATGEMFLAVGVKFTSFKLIDSFALLIAQACERLALTALGVSHLQLPCPEAGGSGSPLAEVYMDWKAVFRPDEGLLGLKAVLAPGSYVFRPDCQLTGGYAYYAWMAGPHAGDFVYSLGGYHPEFDRPAHYPSIERLGLNWVLNDLLHLKGSAYYALTGHALMAGGSLDATVDGGFDAGVAGVHFHGHLTVGADLLMNWEPYHYDAQAGLSLNIDITAYLLSFSRHFSLDVGADLHIWGPEFAGVAHVHLKVWRIRHTLDVSFSGGAARLRPVTWERFCTAFLPLDNHGALDRGAICSVAVKRGLIRTLTDDRSERWVINPNEFVLITNSLIPFGEVGLIGDDTLTPLDFSDDHHEAFSGPAICPMGLRSGELTITHRIKIMRGKKPVTETDFIFTPVRKDVPAGLWGEPSFADERDEFLAKPGVNANRLVKNALAGVEVRPVGPPEPGETHAVDRHELQYECDLVADAYGWSEIDAFRADPAYTGASRGDKAWRHVRETLVNNPARDSILQELGLGSEAIHFGGEPDGYVRDVPYIEVG